MAVKVVAFCPHCRHNVEVTYIRINEDGTMYLEHRVEPTKRAHTWKVPKEDKE